MKLRLLLWLAALLGAVLPRHADGRPAGAPRLRPLLLHLGEELSLRLGGAAGPSTSSSSTQVNRVLLQLAQRLLQAQAEQNEEQEEEKQEQEEQQEQQEQQEEKRSEEPPISLDLTFHLLREVLQMARAEQIAQQADSNRRMMDSYGK